MHNDDVKIQPSSNLSPSQLSSPLGKTKRRGRVRTSHAWVTHSFPHELPGGGDMANTPAAAVTQTLTSAKQVIRSSQIEISG